MPYDKVIFKNENESINNLIARAQNELNYFAPYAVNGKANKKWVNISHFGRDILKDKFLLTKSEYSEIKQDCKLENNSMEQLLGPSFCDKNPLKIFKIHLFFGDSAITSDARTCI